MNSTSEVIILNIYDDGKVIFISNIVSLANCSLYLTFLALWHALRPYERNITTGINWVRGDTNKHSYLIL